MFPFTEQSLEAVPLPPTVAPPVVPKGDVINAAFASMNPYLDRWLLAIGSDDSLPSDAPHVASVMARSVGIGQVAFTDWQRINSALGRTRWDRAVFELLVGLELDGYAARNVDERFGRPYGWLLLLPEARL